VAADAFPGAAASTLPTHATPGVALDLASRTPSSPTADPAPAAITATAAAAFRLAPIAPLSSVAPPPEAPAPTPSAPVTHAYSDPARRDRSERERGEAPAALAPGGVPLAAGPARPQVAADAARAPAAAVAVRERRADGRAVLGQRGAVDRERAPRLEHGLAGDLGRLAEHRADLVVAQARHLAQDQWMREAIGQRADAVERRADLLAQHGPAVRVEPGRRPRGR